MLLGRVDVDASPPVLNKDRKILGDNVDVQAIRIHSVTHVGDGRIDSPGVPGGDRGLKEIHRVRLNGNTRPTPRSTPDQTSPQIFGDRRCRQSRIGEGENKVLPT
jgi:hypothetical protein